MRKYGKCYLFLLVSRMSDPVWEMYFFLSEIIQYPAASFIFIRKRSDHVRHRAETVKAMQFASFSEHLEKFTLPKAVTFPVHWRGKERVTMDIGKRRPEIC